MIARKLIYRNINCLDMCGNTLKTTHELIGGICHQCLGESKLQPRLEKEIKALNTSLLKRLNYA